MILLALALALAAAALFVAAIREHRGARHLRDEAAFIRDEASRLYADRVAAMFRREHELRTSFGEADQIRDAETRAVAFALARRFPDGVLQVWDKGRTVTFERRDLHHRYVVDICALEETTRDGRWRASGVTMQAFNRLVDTLKGEAGEDFSPPARASSVAEGS